MADTGWHSPSSYTDSTGYWTNETNVYTENGSTAYATEQFTTVYGLRVGDFGFEIPDGASVDGIEVRIKSKFVAGSGSSTAVYVRPHADIRLASSADDDYYVESSTTLTERLIGGSTSLWGATWTASEINDTYFGIKVAPYGSQDDVLHVDIIQVKIYYTEDSGGAQVIFIGV